MDPSFLLSTEQIEKNLQETPGLAMWKLQEKKSNSEGEASIPTLSYSFVAKNFQSENSRDRRYQSLKDALPGAPMESPLLSLYIN